MRSRDARRSQTTVRFQIARAAVDWELPELTGSFGTRRIFDALA
jgi:hypothetical protein